MADRSPTQSPPATDDVDDIQRAWQRERPELPTGSIGVITRVWRVAKLLSEDRRRTMHRLGMDPAIRDLLATLRRSGEPYRLPVGEIAERSMVTAGAISQRITRAEQAGWVRRTRHGDDGRSVCVELTSEGHGYIEQTVEELLTHEELLLSALTGVQRDQLSELLRILYADLSQRAR